VGISQVGWSVGRLVDWLLSWLYVFVVVCGCLWLFVVVCGCLKLFEVV